MNEVLFAINYKLGSLLYRLRLVTFSEFFFKRCLMQKPDETSLLMKCATLELKGCHYRDFLCSYHKKHKPHRYIEVGVFKGLSFLLVSPQTKAVGIDPDPLINTQEIAENHLVVTSTSDECFESDIIEKHFDNMPFDLALIDGMHLFEYALRDFVNLEKISHSKSVVLIHDVYPINKESSTRSRNTEFWSGDIWKLILCLKEYRPDLKVEVLPCPPTGVGVISGLDSGSDILSNSYDDIVNQYIDLPFSKIEDRKQELLSVADVNTRWFN